MIQVSDKTYIILGIVYGAVAIILIVVVLVLINKHNKKQYEEILSKLERNKNLIISGNILTELNKVSSLINNKELEKKYESWQKRFNEIKNDDIPKITDLINEVQEYFETKDYANLKASIIKTEMDLNYLQTKSGILLDEIKEITLSEERNRDKIAKLKAEYRNVLTTYKEDPESYSKIKTPLELQFENVDKLFASFENAMDKNAYTEAPKIVKAIDDIVSNLNEIKKKKKRLS